MEIDSAPKKLKIESREFEEIQDLNQRHLLDAFQAWCKDQGACWADVKFVNFTKEGRGLVALRDIPKDGKLCSVPLHMLITKYSIAADPLGKWFENHNEWKNKIADEWIIFYLFLLRQKSMGEKAFWYPYVQLLPEKENMPISFPDSLLEEIKGTNLYEATLQLRTTLQKNYSQLFPELSTKFPDIFPASIFTFEGFVWGYQMFWSRALKVEINGEQIPALVPLADMFNHSHRSKISYMTFNNTNEFSLISHNGVQQGEQAFGNFGPRSNEKLLYNYGFVIENNFMDNVFLKLGYKKEQLSSYKQLLWTKYHLDIENYITPDLDPNYMNPLLNCLRICYMDEVEEYSFSAQKNHFKKEDSIFISVRNELESLFQLITMLNLKISKIKNSVEQDQQILLESNLDPVKRMCLVYRLGQKQIMHKAICHLSQRVIQLGSKNSFLKSSVSVTSDLSGSLLEVYATWFAKTFEDNNRLQLTGDGWICVEDVNPGDKLISFPVSSLMTVHSLNSSDKLAKVFASAGAQLGEETLLVLYVMEDNKNPNSMWKACYEATKLYSPLLVSQQDLQRLKGSFLFEHAKEMRVESKQEAKDLLTLLKKLKVKNDNVFTIENYLWSKVFVETRSKRVLVDGRPLLCVFPFAVLPKHSSRANCFPLLDQKRQTVDFLAGNFFESGSFWHNFLENDSQQLFEYYGVTSTDSAVSLSLITEEQDQDTELQMMKEQIFKQLCLPDVHYLLDAQETPIVFDEKLMASARILTFEKKELDYVCGSLKTLSEEGTANGQNMEKVFEKLNQENETRALELIFFSLSAYLEQLEVKNVDKERDQQWLEYRELQKSRFLPLFENLKKTMPELDVVEVDEPVVIEDGSSKSEIN